MIIHLSQAGLRSRPVWTFNKLRNSCKLVLFKLAQTPPRSGLVQSRALATAIQAEVKHAPHVPVLLDEVLQVFSEQRVTTYVDGTLGAGGHAAAMLASHPEMQTLVALDVDPTALEIASGRLDQLKQDTKSQCRLIFARENYADLKAAVHDTSCVLGGADGILLDLGVSSMQMDTAERGFSISRDGPLDMRMGPSISRSADQIVNTWPEAELVRIFKEFGEERHARKFAARIVSARTQAAIRTTRQLVSAMGSVGRQKGLRQRIHPATKVFQALRIAVNNELQLLEQAVPACIECLAPNGKLAIITFHSLEDRIVKHAFLRASGKHVDGDLVDPLSKSTSLGKVLTRKPVVPSQSEQERNPRSRSAKLRVFQRL